MADLWTRLATVVTGDGPRLRARPRSRFEPDGPNGDDLSETTVEVDATVRVSPATATPPRSEPSSPPPVVTSGLPRTTTVVHPPPEDPTDLTRRDEPEHLRPQTVPSQHPETWQPTTPPSVERHHHVHVHEHAVPPPAPATAHPSPPADGTEVPAASPPTLVELHHWIERGETSTAASTVAHPAASDEPHHPDTIATAGSPVPAPAELRPPEGPTPPVPRGRPAADPVRDDEPVTVTIGRIEIRRPPTPAAPRRTPRPEPLHFAGPSLDDFLGGNR